MKNIVTLNELEKAVGFRELNRLFTEYSMLAIGKLIEDGVSSVKDLTEDAYGNNVSFPDYIMSDITTKGLLGKQCRKIFTDIKNALRTGDTDRAKAVRAEISVATPILEDLVIADIRGIEDIFTAVYGVGSDEVYTLNVFLRLDDGCLSDTDSRLNAILGAK